MKRIKMLFIPPYLRDGIEPIPTRKMLFCEKSIVYSGILIAKLSMWFCPSPLPPHPVRLDIPRRQTFLGAGIY